MKICLDICPWTFRLQNSHIFCEHEQGLGYLNEMSGVSVKTARENGERRFTLEKDHINGALCLPKTSKNDCFAVYWTLSVP